MRTAHANEAIGRRYNQEFSDLLKANGFDAIDKSTRSRLFGILDNIDDVEKWLATVPANKRLTLNHPHTIWRAYQRTIVKKSHDNTPKKPSHTEKLTASIVALEEENARMKRAIERGGGDLWTPQDTPKDIARVIFGTISRSKAREVAREINKLVREVEKATAPQTTVEARA
jgi:hypothetical protein